MQKWCSQYMKHRNPGGWGWVGILDMTVPYNIQAVSHGFSSTVMFAMWPSEELHLVRHLGLGREDSM